jgi:hypothetical protein
VKRTFAIIGLVAAAFSTTTAYAEIGVSGTAGTTGVGAQATIPLRPNLDLRLGAGYLSHSYSGNTQSLNYDLELKAKTYDALLDWFPSEKSSFRVTAGLAYNGNKIEAHAKPNASGNYTIQGNTYDASNVGQINGTTDFRKLAPYLGIGWGRSAGRDKKGWSFSTDIGVLFQGSARTSLSSSGCSAQTAACSRLAADLAKENSALNDEARKYRAYPVLRIGVGYAF